MAERRESVRVSATGSDFSREFNKLSRDAAELQAAIRAIPNHVTVKADARGFDKVEQQARRADRSSSALIDTAVAIAPAFAPVAALAVPALAGLTAQLGFSVAAAGSAVLAFHGVGDALKALDAYQVSPTAANLEKLNQTMDSLGPSGRAFVHELDAIEPKLKAIKEDAENGLLPGVTEGLDALLTRLPQIRRIVSEVSGVSGQIAGEAGRGLAGSGFDDFFAYLQSDARPILLDTARAAGNLTEGIAHLFTDFAPQEREFSRFLLDSARGFNDFADGLDQTQGFQEFLDFVHTNGPLVADALGSIGGAIVSLVKASAPLSGPTLHALSAVADIIDRIASSPLGTPLVALASGLALVNRALVTRDLARGSTLGQLISGRSTGIERARTSVRGLVGDLRTANALGSFAGTKALATPQQLEAQAAAAGRLRGNLANLGKGTAVVGGLALATSDYADQAGLANTATYALAGTIAGPWGAAVGAGIGFAKDFSEANASLKETIAQTNDVLAHGTTAAIASQGAAIRKGIAQNKKDTTVNLFDLDPVAQSKAVLSGLDNLVHGTSAKAQNDLRDVNTALDMRRNRAQLDELRRGFQLTAEGVDAAGRSIEAWSTLTDRALGRVNAQAAFDAYKQSIDDATAALKDNGRTLDANTTKGRGNRAALRNIASDALQAAQSMSGVAKIDFLDSARTNLVKAARQLGATRSEAKHLADVFGLLDRKKVAPKITAQGADAVQNKLDRLLDLTNALGKKHPKPTVGILDHASNPLLGILSLYNRLKSKQVVVDVVTNHSKGNPSAPIVNGPASAAGNFFAAYAAGGFDRRDSHLPELAGPGPTRMWREPETRGESYIPHANDWRRPRAKAITEQTATLFGGRVLWNAAGALYGPAASSRPPTVRVSQAALPAIQVNVATDFRGEIISTAQWAAEQAVTSAADMDRQSAMAGGGSGY